MFKRIALLTATGLMAAACASSPAVEPPAVALPGAAVTPGPATPAGTMTVANMAATTFWLAEENLIPDDPILALVNNGARNADTNAGIAVVCKAANGNISFRLGKQPATRVGQAATFKLRAGPGARDIEGKFEANRRSPEADFVFPITSADLLAMGQLDMVSLVSDQGEVQWALVKSPTATPQAKYVGSLKNFSTAASDFLNYCNPK